MNHELGPSGRALLGALGGLVPIAIRVLIATRGFEASLPRFGGGFLLHIAVAVGIGAVGSIVFKAHDVFTAVYHGTIAVPLFTFLGMGHQAS